jgi:hypothetical protein
MRLLTSSGSGGLVLWIAMLIVAGPAVVILFYLFTGRPLPEWARASTFSEALKAFFSSRTQSAAPALRADFDVSGFLREAKEIFLKLQTRGAAELTRDWRELLAPGLRAELEAHGLAPRVDAVERIEAEFLGVDTDDQQLLASVRFSGLAGDGPGSAPISQIWEFSRSAPAGRWLVTNIETLNAVATTAVKNSLDQQVYRLAPRESRRRQIWTSLAIGLIVGMVGLLLLKDACGHEVQDLGDLLDGNLWVEFLIGVVFCLLALLALWRAIVTFLSLGRHETVVEVLPRHFARGTKVTITFRQPGPMSLKSLRANLVGQETWSQVKDKGFRDLGTHELLSSGPREISSDQPYETTVTLLVPRDLSPSGPTAKDHEVEWVIEVYGKANGGMDFSHSYPVQIG